VVRSAKILRPEDFAELTTPSARNKVASRLSDLIAQPPLLCEEGNIAPKSSQWKTRPPSATINCPVIKDASSDKRKEITPTMSSTVPSR